MALVGNCFYQASSLDPGAGYPMYFWAQTNTGLLFIRNAADTAWVEVGDSAQPYLGQLSTQGGNMNGAITGAHGLSPAASNDFNAASLRMGGDLVSTKVYVDAQVALLNASIASGIASAISSSPASSVYTKVAKLTGVWGPFNDNTGGTRTIPLPTYSDGVLADESECTWGVAISRFKFGHIFTSGSTEASAIETATLRTYTITKTDSGEGSEVYFDWWIQAYRKSS